MYNIIKVDSALKYICTILRAENVPKIGVNNYVSQSEARTDCYKKKNKNNKREEMYCENRPFRVIKEGFSEFSDCKRIKN